MSKLDISRLNALTDELEQRVKNLEIKKVNKEDIVTFECLDENLVFKPTNKEKVYKFISNKSTYIVVNLDVKSSATFIVECEIYANDVLIKNFSTNFPFTCELPVQTINGENTLKIVMYSTTITASFKLDIGLSIMGDLKIKDANYKVGAFFDELVYFKKNDTIKCINANTMSVTYCYTGKEVLGAGYLRGNYTLIVVKEGDVVKLDKYSKDGVDPYNTQYMYENFTACSAEVNNGVTFIIFIKGENVYMHATGTKTFFKKLPFKAKEVYTYRGETGRYIYYIDLRGNCNVIKHLSYTDYREEKRVSLGKLENVNLCEENGRLVALYKQGLVVLKKPVFENESPQIVGVGDEAVISGNGVTIIRRKDKLVKL